MRWGLIGCKAQTLQILQGCIEAAVAPSFVVTLPNQPVEEISALKDLVSDNQIPLYILTHLSQIQSQLKACDFIMTCRYSLLPEAIFSLPRLGAINIHNSLLPEYRGVHPLHWAMINGECQTGITAHHIDAGIDTGRVIAQQQCLILADDSIGDLFRRIERLSQLFVVAIIQSIYENQFIAAGSVQTPGHYFYARRRKQADSEIDWSQPMASIQNLIRAMQHPWPHAYAFDKWGRKFEIASSSIKNTFINNKVTPGTIIDSRNQCYLIQCIDGVLQVKFQHDPLT